VTTNNTGDGHVIVWDESGGLFRLPQPIFEQYRLSEDERAEVEGLLLTATWSPGEAGSGPTASWTDSPEATPLTADDFINPIPHEVLAPYSISSEDLVAMASDDEVQGHGQFIGIFPQESTGYGPTGIGGKWAIRTLPSYQIVAMNNAIGGNGACPRLH
jgi:hypothetical protein